MSQQPHVGVIARYLNAQAGLGTMERNLVAELARLAGGFRITVFTDAEPPQRASGLDYRIVPLPRRGGQRSRQFVWDQLVVPKVVRRHRPDILHWLHPTATLLPTPGKTVITVHDATPWEAAYRRSLKMRAYSDIDKLAVRRADHVITISQYSKQDIARATGVPAGRITVTYEAGPPRVSNPPRLPEGTKQPYILFLGGSEVRKNPSRLIRAFAAAKIPPEIQLVVAGSIKESPIDEDVTGLVRSLPPQTQNRISLAGRVSEQQLNRLYAHALFFAYPSLREGFGIPPLEAMAHGTPVLTSNTTSVPEVVGEAGLLVDPTAVSDLTRAIERLSTDAAHRKELVERGYRQLDHFSWRRMAEETAAVYEKVLSQTEPAAGQAS